MSFEDVARMISNKIASYEQSSRQREELTKSMDKDVADIKILFQSLCSSVVAMKVPSGSDVLNLPIVCSGQQLTKIEFQRRIEYFSVRIFSLVGKVTHSIPSAPFQCEI